MRLLRVDNGGNFSLVERVGNNIPRYAILSHTWGEDNEEVTISDIIGGTGRDKAGFRKIQFCGEQAAKDKLEYFWVDTCCIDKSSSMELQEAINSMFQWYHKAAKCYVYLSDVASNGFVDVDQLFRRSKWFTRGWTLQELIAPTYVEFYSFEGKQIGDKNSMMQDIYNITGIPIEALQGNPLTQFSIDERKSWAANRHTKREEDAAYSLLGIFDIHMPLLYGEGQIKAFARLERKIKKSLEYRLSTTPLLGLSTEQQDHKQELFSSRHSGEEQYFVERPDVPGILNVRTSAPKHAEGWEDVIATPRYAVPEFDGNKPKPQIRMNVTRTLDEMIKELPDLQSEGQDLETVLKRILSHAHPSGEVQEHTRSQLRTDSESHGDAFDRISEFPKENTSEKNNILVAKLLKDEPDGAFRREGMLSQQVEMSTNRPSNLVPPTNPVPYFWQQLNELDSHFKGRTPLPCDMRGLHICLDKQILDQLGNAGVQTILQLLHDLNLRARLESQATVNDWLDVTKYNDGYNVTQYFDKQVSTRLEGTCEWILSHPAYRAWISDDRPVEGAKVLWIYGPAGYGKTVMCANLVEYLNAKESFPIAYFFASPHAQSGGDPSFIIRSWISQIAQLDLNVLSLVRRQCEAGGRASESAIWSLFESIVSEPRSYFFFLDGFDEYSRLEDARTHFLQKLKESTKRTISRILITSRDETDLHTELSPKVTQVNNHNIYHCRITKEEVRHDILRLAKNVVDKKLSNKDNGLRQDLAGQLAEKCEGMFLWIRLQQDQLRGGKNAKQLQNIINNMPIGLEKTYERNWKIIQSYPPEDQNRALAILRWITFALRPLTVSEITEALIVELNDNGNTIHWDELPDNIDDEYIKSEIIDICGALVEIRTEKNGVGAGYKTIHLIHPSVREYLLSTLQQTPLDTSGHSLKSEPPHTPAEQHKYLATICLSYLSCDDTWQQRTPQEAEERGSFSYYAARQWNSHMSAAGDNDFELVRLAKAFFHPRNKNFEHWRRLLEASSASSVEGERTDTDPASPLYYAALLNLSAVMEHIWAEDPAQLNMVGGEYGTPLQVVCFKGHKSAFDLLIRWGANINEEGGKYGVPINAAIAGRQTCLAKAILRMGVDDTLKDPMGRTPLYTAALNGNAEIVRLLIEAGSDQNTTNKYGLTALSAASNDGHYEVVKLLLEKGADISMANNKGWTPLNSASNHGHIDVVELLLEKGADITVTDIDGWTPLSLASHSGHVEVVKLLLEKGADITDTDSNGWTPLNLASYKGHIDVVELLLEKEVDITVTSNNGLTPLNAASTQGHFKIVNLLLEKGADITVTSNEGWTPLNSASDSGHVDVVKLLLEKGADIQVADDDGWTPLNSATNGSHVDVVNLLLENGANINAANNGGWTPLNVASTKGYFEVVNILLEKGAGITLANNQGRTPLHSASDSGHVDVVKLLLEKGADIQVADDQGWTPLHSASNNGHVDVVNLLLEKGADILVADDQGWTPLHSASNNGHLEVVTLLLERGADLTVPNNSRWTPLHSTSNNGHIEVVKLLLEKGADITAANNDGWTPLNSASNSGHLEVVKLLLEKAADISVANNEDWTPLNVASAKGYFNIVEFLLENGADLTVANNNGSTPLNSASNNGHLEVIKLLLKKGADITVANDYGWTPLHSASSNDHLEVVRFLVEKGANVTVANNYGWTSVNLASNNGHLGIVKFLLEKGADITVANNDGLTPLNSASNNGHLEVVKLLLKNI
jgi:ankyrin repeat protein